MENSATNNFFKDKVLGHPSGLFVLFFTEMWGTLFVLRDAGTFNIVLYRIIDG